MRVDLFDFDLPPERIAYAPANPRDSARLLHVSESLRDLQVRDLPSLLNPGDVLGMNNSRVIPARLFAEVNGRKIFCEREHHPLFQLTRRFCKCSPHCVCGVIIDRLMQQHFDFSAVYLCKKARGNHAAIVHHQHIAGVEERR